jgi:hypothetical protein
VYYVDLDFGVWRPGQNSSRKKKKKAKFVDNVFPVDFREEKEATKAPLQQKQQ